MIKDYYYLLGLPRGAPLSDIKQAYRKLATQYHPDKVAGLSAEAREEATAKMTELNEAIAVLSDPERRAEYDENIQYIPERKPKPARAAKPAEAKTPESRAAASAGSSPPPSPAATTVSPPQVETPPPTRPAAPSEPPPPTTAPGPEQRGILAEEHIHKLQAALKKLPLKWSEARLPGWQWALEAGNLRRSVLVGHRHLETLSLLSVRSLQASLEGLLEKHKHALRATTIILLVSYDRLMDAKAVQGQLQGMVGDTRGWLKNVRPLIVLYDGQTQRAGVFGTAGEDIEVQRVVRLLLAGH